MRKQFVECSTTDQAREDCPWAAVVLPAEGGYWCFESVADAETWQAQS